MTIGERIKKSRENANLSQTELAEKLNTSKQTIYKYENGIVTNIPSDKIENMAKIFDVSPAYIMGWEEAARTDAYNIPEITAPTEVDPDMFILDMYKMLDTEDKAEIRGEMKHMLKADKYADKKAIGL